MPKLSQIRNVDLSNRTPVRAQANQAAALRAENAPSTAPVPDATAQSPLMISSLPGLVTGADGVIRQYYGGRALPRIRTVAL
jgi:hypothetical protein